MGEEAAETGSRRGASGGKRDLGSRLRVSRQRVQVQAMDDDKSGRLSRWAGDLIPEKKGENWVRKERCSSV